jgi:hypothetical protein
MENYIFNEILFKNKKIKLFSDDFNELKFIYNDINNDTIKLYINNLINLLDNDLNDYEFDVYKYKKGNINSIDKYITGNIVSNIIKNDNIIINDNDINNLKLIKFSLYN